VRIYNFAISFRSTQEHKILHLFRVICIKCQHTTRHRTVREMCIGFVIVEKQYGAVHWQMATFVTDSLNFRFSSAKMIRRKLVQKKGESVGTGRTLICDRTANLVVTKCVILCTARMYVCVYVCIYVLCMYACMHACMYVCKYVCIYVCMYYYVRTYVCMYARMYVCTYVCLCMYVFPVLVMCLLE
jgi:hypothetical protein